MMITTVSDPNQPTLFPLPSRPEMERAYLRSDASYDGLFFLGVRTTGVFCRPSCHARKPKPENVDFFASSGEAIEAGYRACLKCKPVGGTDEPAWVRALFRRLEARPAARVTERDLRAMQLDPERVRRYFSARYGLTFQAYCRARRLAGAFERLKDGRALDDAVFDTGYESHSGFRDAFRKAFGRPPGQAAAAACIQVAWLDTPLGPVIAGATDRGVCLLEFTDRRQIEQQIATLGRHFKAPLAPGSHRHLAGLEAELAEYFSGARRTFEVPVHAPGTPFEERVWRALLAIPYGETRSYRDIARAVGSPKAVRAVGRANGRNRVAIVIPCHRVVNTGGALGGYGGGLWRKRRLLHLERAAADRGR
jgi:AraC family transcriptional regulator of adaptative response/methylated-DNA-[protein]-cysteine methyltransferase